MKKKIIAFFTSIILIIGVCSNVKAAELKTKLDIIKQASETKNLENNDGFISKTIVDSNANTGEVTIELKLSNNKKETNVSNDTEIIFVVDNSPSMEYKTVNGETRKQIVLNSAKILVNSIFDVSSNIRMGVVKFSGETGLLSPLYAASVITELTSDKEQILNGLNNIETKSYSESGTNIQKGLIKAEEMFSENAGNKFIILLTDGCPNEDALKNSVSSSGMVMSNENYLKILENTKNEILNVSNKGISLISLMTGINSNDVDEYGDTVTNTEDDIKAVEKIFGTESNPTAGKFYNAKTTEVSNIIKNNITNDVTKILNSPINAVKVVDYFPEDITNNFEFSYVGNPSIGTKTDGIDKDTNTITWDIGTLKGDEVATLKYKLKIKDMKNTELLNKTIATNEKVVITYKDKEAKDYEVTLTSSPEIKLSEVENTVENNESDDNDKKDQSTNNTNENNGQDSTTAKGKLPQTGLNMTAAISLITVIVVAAVMYKMYNRYRDIK